MPRTLFPKSRATSAWDAEIRMSFALVRAARWGSTSGRGRPAAGRRRTGPHIASPRCLISDRDEPRPGTWSCCRLASADVLFDATDKGGSLRIEPPQKRVVRRQFRRCQAGVRQNRCCQRPEVICLARRQQTCACDDDHDWVQVDPDGVQTERRGPYKSSCRCRSTDPTRLRRAVAWRCAATRGRIAQITGVVGKEAFPPSLQRLFRFGETMRNAWPSVGPWADARAVRSPDHGA